MGIARGGGDAPPQMSRLRRGLAPMESGEFRPDRDRGWLDIFEEGSTHDLFELPHGVDVLVRCGHALTSGAG